MDRLAKVHRPGDIPDDELQVRAAFIGSEPGARPALVAH